MELPDFAVEAIADHDARDIHETESHEVVEGRGAIHPTHAGGPEERRVLRHESQGDVVPPSQVYTSIIPLLPNEPFELVKSPPFRTTRSAEGNIYTAK